MTALVMAALAAALAVVRLAEWWPEHRAGVAAATADHVAWVRRVKAQQATRPEFLGRSWLEVTR